MSCWREIFKEQNREDLSKSIERDELSTPIGDTEASMPITTIKYPLEKIIVRLSDSKLSTTMWNFAQSWFPIAQTSQLHSISL